MRRAPLIAVVLVALAAAPPALADDPPPPTITLLAPADGTKVSLDANAKPPTFSWRIEYAAAPSNPVVFLEISTDPTFKGPRYSESRACDTANPTCFTSSTPAPYWASSATGGAPAPLKGDVTLYWRVTTTYAFAKEAAASTSWTLLGNAQPQVKPDTEAPRVLVTPTTVKRGRRAHVHFRVDDNEHVVQAVARLLWRGVEIGRVSGRLTQTSWLDLYDFWFDVPRNVPKGKYKACIRATDDAGNSTERCAAVTIR